MKIAWFTPFSRKSAIGKYSQIATNKLIEYCDIDLWLFEDENLLETSIPAVFYNYQDDLRARLAEYDLIIYNLGDYLPYHKDIYEVSKQVEGIIILHDFIMHNFFYSYYFEYKKNQALYIKDMEKLYGGAGKKIAEKSLAGQCKPAWDIEHIDSYPFFEAAIENALAVITHSYFLSDKVKRKFKGSVQTIYFPFLMDTYLFERTSKISKVDLGIPNNKILLLTTGNVNENKRIHKVIEVIGKNKDLKERIIYVILGSFVKNEYYGKIQELIKKYNLEKNVNFLGFQPDDILRNYLQNADLIANLRLPATEGASWSLLEQLYFKKPVIVTDIGFYQEIPDNCVMKVRPDCETEDIETNLRSLISDTGSREKVGANAQMFAMENFNPDKYSIRFIEFCQSIISQKPIVSLIDKVSLEMSLMGVRSDMETINEITDKIIELTT